MRLRGQGELRGLVQFGGRAEEKTRHSVETQTRGQGGLHRKVAIMGAGKGVGGDGAAKEALKRVGRKRQGLHLAHRLHEKQAEFGQIQKGGLGAFEVEAVVREGAGREEGALRLAQREGRGRHGVQRDPGGTVV